MLLVICRHERFYVINLYHYSKVGRIRIDCYTKPEKGTRGNVVVKALCYKPEGRGFDTR
jgi:hypothetical protein